MNLSPQKKEPVCNQVDPVHWRLPDRRLLCNVKSNYPLFSAERDKVTCKNCVRMLRNREAQ